MNNKMVIQKVKKENQIIKIKETTKEHPQNNQKTSANRKEIKINFKKNE